MTEHHAPSSLHVPLRSLPEFVLLKAGAVPDKPAVIDGLTGRSISYGELAEAAGRTAAGLRARGFGKGDVLAIWSPNLPEYAVVLSAPAWPAESSPPSIRSQRYRSSPTNPRLGAERW
jgi:non-ribosomal peptide synthetase component F